jgi:hypothetical protein
MNRYVIVFTIMTILFLPPSFSVVSHYQPLALYLVVGTDRSYESVK